MFGVTQTKHEAKKAGYVEAEHVRDLGRLVVTDHRYRISSSIIEEKLLPVTVKSASKSVSVKIQARSYSFPALGLLLLLLLLF